MTPDRGSGQAEPRGQACRGYRAVLQDQPRDPGPGAPFGARLGLHNLGLHNLGLRSTLPVPVIGGVRMRICRAHVFHNIIVP